MKTLCTLILAIMLVSCDEPNKIRTKTNSINFEDWERATLYVGARWTYPPPTNMTRCVLVEGNSEFSKYRVNPTTAGFYFVTVKRDTVVSIWSTIQR